jgi:hypothetical protein
VQDSSAPTKLVAKWAYGASAPYIRSIPPLSQIGIQNGAASLQDGFPPNCFVPLAAGGAGPFGEDMNGILNQTTALVQWLQMGGPLPFDATYAAAIGGYPAGSVVASATTVGLLWVSLTDNNTGDPDSSSNTTWIPLISNAIAPSGVGINKFRNATAVIAQRGASPGAVVAGAGPTYGIDGMMLSCTGANVTPSQAASVGLAPNSIQITGAAGATDVQLILPIESIDTFSLAGKACTFQCKILNSTGASILVQLSVLTPTSTDTWTSSNVVLVPTPLQSAPNGAVTLLSATFDMPLSAQNGASVHLDFLTALNGNGKYVQLGDFDLRAGTGVSFPEIRPYFLEFLQCQRYLPGLFPRATGHAGGGGNFSSATAGGIDITFNTPTRVAVTGVSLSATADWNINAGGNVWTVTGWSFNGSTDIVGSLAFTGASGGGSYTPAQGHTSGLITANSSARLFFTGAEIIGGAI